MWQYFFSIDASITWQGEQILQHTIVQDCRELCDGCRVGTLCNLCNGFVCNFGSCALEMQSKCIRKLFHEHAVASTELPCFERGIATFHLSDRGERSLAKSHRTVLLDEVAMFLKKINEIKFAGIDE